MVKALFGCYAGWCHVKLLPSSAHVLCTTAQIHFIRSHIRRVHVCLAVSCHLPFWAECPGSFTFYCGNTGEERIRNKSQHKKGGRKKERQTERKKTKTSRTYCPFGPRMSGGRVSSLSGRSVASPSRVERVLRRRGVLIFKPVFVAFTFRSSSANYFKWEVEDLKRAVFSLCRDISRTAYSESNRSKRSRSIPPLSFCPHSVCRQM